MFKYDRPRYASPFFAVRPIQLASPDHASSSPDIALDWPFSLQVVRSLVMIGLRRIINFIAESKKRKNLPA